MNYGYEIWTADAAFREESIEDFSPVLVTSLLRTWDFFKSYYLQWWIDNSQNLDRLYIWTTLGDESLENFWVAWHFGKLNISSCL